MRETKFKQTEVGMIPNDWEVKPVSEFGNLTSGESPSRFKFVYTGVPYFKVEQMNNCLKYQVETPFHIELTKTVSKGSIIFPKRGAAIETNKIRILNQDSFFDTNIMALTLLNGIDSEYIFYWLVRYGLWKIADTTSIPQINNKHVNPLLVPLPPLDEQKRIAQALSDVDTVISITEKLIAKKKALKQGTMQTLLSGKMRIQNGKWIKTTHFKQTELGPIPQEWEVKRTGSLLKIGHGRDYKHLATGNIPVFGTGGYMTSVNDYLYDGETVCIGRKGTIDKPFYYNGKIWTVDTLFYTYGFNGCIPKFVYYAFCLVDWLAKNEASGVPSLTSKNIEDVLLRTPPKSEQSAIATVLSDMDTEILALETKLAKYRQLKTGMMQQLLTGKIRLV